MTRCSVSDGTLSERELFHRFTAEADGIIPSGQFDDAAVIATGGAENLVISTDFIRGPQFDLAQAGYLSFGDLAHYLVAANASDIAAMGVRPVGFLDIFRYPPGTPREVQEAFIGGLRDAARRYSVEIVGGDSGGYSSFVLGGTCFGFASKQRILRRSNARAGQSICLAGLPGRCRAAQVALLEDRATPFDPELPESLLAAWRRPTPPLKLGAWLGETGLAAAAQDTSDGLGSAVRDICERSGVGAVIEADRLPISAAVCRVAEAARWSPAALALATSPDFCLVFTADTESLGEIESNPVGEAVTVIGHIVDGEHAVLVEGGKRHVLPLETYDHRIPFGSIAPE